MKQPQKESPVWHAPWMPEEETNGHEAGKHGLVV